MRSNSSVVVVGNGAAGIGVAQFLRAEGYEGLITIVGDEVAEPYDRPPLSKQVLTGVWAPDRAALLPRVRLEALQARFRTGTAAVGLDLDGHRVHLQDGSHVDYDQVVVATGVRPREISHESLTNVFVLRTLQHALKLRTALSTPGTKLVVIGGGFLGLEVASSARLMGAEVTVVEPVPGILLRSRIGETAAAKLQAMHKRHGVRLITGVGVVALAGRPEDLSSSFAKAIEEPWQSAAVRAVELTDGTALEADVVLVAIGCTPNVEWLDGSGLTLDNGIVCDESCSAAIDVWASGDVARWLHLGVGRHVRLEHRTNATEQGQAVARNMLGHDEPFVPVPFFWTDHYDVKIQFAGFLPPDAEFEVVEGCADGRSFVLRIYKHGVFVGVLGWNSPRKLLLHREALLKASPGGVTR